LSNQIFKFCFTCEAGSQIVSLHRRESPFGLRTFFFQIFLPYITRRSKCTIFDCTHRTYGNERSKLNNERNELNNERSELNNERSELNNERSELNNERSELNNERSELNNERSELNNERSELNNERSELNNKRNELDNDYEIIDFFNLFFMYFIFCLIKNRLQSSIATDFYNKLRAKQVRTLAIPYGDRALW